MKKIKKIVLSVLMLAFIFVSLHDYIVLEPQCNLENSIEKVVFGDMDSNLNIHESIHHMLVVWENKTITTPFTKIQLQQNNTDLLFTSHIGTVPQRPPLS